MEINFHLDSWSRPMRSYFVYEWFNACVIGQEVETSNSDQIFQYLFIL